MRSLDNRPIAVKKLVIISISKKILVKNFLNKDPLNGIANFIGLQEIEANGIGTIKQLFKLGAPYACIPKSIKIVTDREMSREDVVNIIENPNNSPYFPDYNELQIVGPLPASIIGFLYNKTRGHTKKISITCEPSQVDYMKQHGTPEITLRSEFKELFLIDGAILLAFRGALTLFKSKIDRLVLDFPELQTELFEKHGIINLLECDSLELNNKMVNILPLISRVSLRSIKRIYMNYKKRCCLIVHSFRLCRMW
eukprot:GHVP01019973.1.p2 GENE.GHVP01019973.1~~GHVP01019973.1.p2  ORF type:complete len:254 (+),score=27.02 GHVP01019973.1:2530-3291(+)